jgi:type II secretory pathway component PulC
MSFKKPLLLINICLAVLVLCIALNTFHTWNYKRHEKTRLQDEVLRPKSLNGKSSAKPKKPEDYEIIISRDIFKTKKDPQKASTEQEKTIKITDLNLKLMGTVVGKDRDCFAIIMDGSTKKLDLYHLNDFIQGTRIVGILSDRVILDLEGREECLMFTDEPSPSVRKAPPKRKMPNSIRKRRKRPAIQK